MFKSALMIYVDEYVEKCKIKTKGFLNPRGDQVKILSFNYSKTEEKYKEFNSSDSCHVHGDISLGEIVLGIDSEKKQEKEFLYFTKNFQRLTRVRDYKYKEFISSKEYTLKVLGLSLHKNDSHIYKPFIEHSKYTEVFYYSQRDLEEKMANLIDTFGNDKIEEMIMSNKLIFNELPLEEAIEAR